jgi:excisionase family DNA binding protein
MSDKELLTADETAAKLSVTRRTILKWARENRLESIKISNKKILFSREAIDEFLKSKTNEIELPRLNHQGAARQMTGPTPKRKGGDSPSSRKSWRSLREEVTTWQ